jgi:hypothetical protein
MSLPRPVLPGCTYKITRRCTQRQFLMRPDAETNNAFVYCLAEAAQRFGIIVLCLKVLSNHYHVDVHDPHGNYPEFLERFHRHFAKCQNALRGRWENFWSSEQTSVVRLDGPEDVLKAMIYTLTNPVKDHLVDRAIDWPGVSSLLSLLTGKALKAHRPKHFFREEGPMPKEMTLHFARPAGFEYLSDQEFTGLVMQRIEQVERKAREERGGARVLGVKGVLRQSWRDRPDTMEPRRKLKPSVAAQNKWRRIESLLRKKAFQLEYRKAYEAFKLGLGNVLFPDGTYWMRRFAGVLCNVPFA